MRRWLGKVLTGLIGRLRTRDWDCRSVVEEHHMSDGSVRVFVREASWDYVGEKATPPPAKKTQIPLSDTEHG